MERNTLIEGASSQQDDEIYKKDDNLIVSSQVTRGTYLPDLQNNLLSSEQQQFKRGGTQLIGLYPSETGENK